MWWCYRCINFSLHLSFQELLQVVCQNGLLNWSCLRTCNSTHANIIPL